MMVVWKFIIHTHLMNGSNCTLLVHGVVMSLPFAVNVFVLRPLSSPPLPFFDIFESDRSSLIACRSSTFTQDLREKTGCITALSAGGHMLEGTLISSRRLPMRVCGYGYGCALGPV